MSSIENQCEHCVDAGAYVLGALEEHEVESYRDILLPVPRVARRWPSCRR